jgi:drug/metabolite transporter (DMT)-like permease
MIGSDLAAVVFGLASALTWGAGDFSGGLATKRTPLFTVLAIGQGAGLLLMLALALLWGESIPPLLDLTWALVGGMAGAFGVAALYRALSVGRMGMVAPVSAVVTVALPLLFAAITEGLPGAPKLAGFGLALLGIWLIARSDGAEGGRAGLGLALLAGCGFGLFFILLHRAGASAVFWPLAVARCGSLALVLPVALARRQLAWPAGRLAVPVLLSGGLDVAGNGFFVLASQAGRLDVAAILASMYPASTVLLAGILLGERATRSQLLGIVAVLSAIALIAS